MKKAVVISASEVSKILADKFNVPESNVLKQKYSFVVILDEESDDE